MRVAPIPVVTWPEFVPRFPHRRGNNRPTQVYIVCSARPHVGKTLLARLIVEYCRADFQPVNAYTINPIDIALSDFLPGAASAISLTETRGQMALFDRLVIDDAITKVVDAGHQALDRLFTIAYDIEFAAEAHSRGIEVLVMYVADPSERARRTYTALRSRFPEFSFVPVFNEAVARGFEFRSMFPGSPGGIQPLVLPQMPAAICGIVDSYPFSFTDFLRHPPPNVPRSLLDEIENFMKRVHRQLRETELALLLGRLRLSLAERPATSHYF